MIPLIATPIPIPTRVLPAAANKFMPTAAILDAVETLVREEAKSVTVPIPPLRVPI